MGYYFLSIGGSGAKVMESLTHLCAAGLLPNRERQEKLYIMTIDPDVGNGNLKRSSAALNNLCVFQRFATGRNTPLFKTEVITAEPFIWNPVEHDKKLDDVMAYMSYKDTPIGSLYETLYTQKERNTFLNEGFRGHPSIGAAVMAKKVVLNDTEFVSDDNEPWGTFEKLVRADAKNGETARIFIAGSVFGGTGAAGLPTISQLLHNRFKELCDEGKVIIGGALILPYFSFTKPAEYEGELAAKAENFLTNTQAALKYYSIKEKYYDAMYLIGDDLRAEVKDFSVGASSQNNDAHIVDFYGAMAAIDFYSKSKEQLNSCSYISRNNENCYDWSGFPDIVMDGKNVRVKDLFAQFIRFIFAYAHIVKPVLHDLASGKIDNYIYPWYVDYLEGFDLDTNEIKNFEEYVESFVRWLGQIGANGTQREVKMVYPDAFSFSPAAIVPEKFANCICEEDTDITVHELWYRLSENTGRDEENTEGFGRFLRKLYDCCAKK